MQRLKEEIVKHLSSGEELVIRNNEICCNARDVAAEYNRLKQSGQKIDLMNLLEEMRDNAKSVKLFSLIYSDGKNYMHMTSKSISNLVFEVTNEMADKIMRENGHEPIGMHGNKKNNIIKFLFEDLFDVRTSGAVQGYYVPVFKKNKDEWVVTVGCVVNEKGEMV